MAATLQKDHLAGSMSNYIKGLIALDAIHTLGPQDITNVPPWVIVVYKLDVIAGKVQPRKPS